MVFIWPFFVLMLDYGNFAASAFCIKSGTQQPYGACTWRPFAFDAVLAVLSPFTSCARHLSHEQSSHITLNEIVSLHALVPISTSLCSW